MSTCDHQATGLIELYFYGELEPAEHARLDVHVSGCAECRRVLEDLHTIRHALAARPDVAAPAGGDWAPFMARLEQAVRRDQTTGTEGLHAPARGVRGSAVTAAQESEVKPSYVGYLAMAALLALVTISVLLAWRTADRSGGVQVADGAGPAGTIAGGAQADTAGDAAFVSLSEQHFERSKLVVLGLTTKDPAGTSGADWQYERKLAEQLLNDTRLYRLAAEERGLISLARVMQDLELVLLQTSMSDESDASALEQLQRLIRKRDLVTKIEFVTTIAGI